MADSQRLIDPSDLRKYRHELPNLVDDAGLSPFAYRLYGHIKRRCGASDGGECYEGTRKMAEHCKMSAGMVFKAKRELEDAGLIKIVYGDAKTNTADTITVVDVWRENFRRYQTCSPDEQGVHGMNRPVHGRAHTCSPDEHKKEPPEEITTEEDRGTVGKKRRRAPSVPDDEFLDELQAKPAYTALDVRHVYAKMSVWCEAKRKQPTRMRLINWLNREDVPMNGGNHGGNGRAQNGANGNSGNAGQGRTPYAERRASARATAQRQYDDDSI